MDVTHAEFAIVEQPDDPHSSGIGTRLEQRTEAGELRLRHTA